MKSFFFITLLLLAIVFALAMAEQHPVRDAVVKRQKRRNKRRQLKTAKPYKPNKWTFFAVMSAGQEVNGAGKKGREACDSPGMGNAVARLQKNELCIYLSYSGLVGKEIVSHIHGPAKIGETAPNLFKLSPRPIKNDCIQLNKDQVKDLRKGLYYFNIHTTHCSASEIRGQILPVT